MATPSGDFHGTLTLAPHGDQIPIDLSFTVDGDSIRGKGTSFDGPCSIEGKADKRGFRFQTKPESGAPPTVWVAAFDESKRVLDGKWRVVNSMPHGKFTMKAGKRGGDAPPTKSPKELVEELYAKQQKTCSLDLATVRFDGEPAMLTALVGDVDFYNGMQAGASLAPDPRREAQLAAMMVRLTPTILPHAFRALSRATEVIGLQRKVVMFCSNDGSLNAMVSSSEDGTIRVVLTSGLLDALDEKELCYVIGHELGHAVLGHLDVRVANDQQLSGLTVLRHFALRRYQELSADRVGLLCCPDVEKVLRAELMLHSGITTRDRVGEAREILRAAEESLVATRSTDFGIDAKYATHPYGPMRTLSIAHFARSTTFARLAKTAPPPDAIDEAGLEKKVQEVMDLMNPVELGATTDVSGDVTKFIALGALQLAAANDGVSDAEVTAIKRLSGVEHVLEPLRSLSFEEQQVEVAEVAEKLTLAVPPAKRLRLLEDLAVIAAADGNISGEEDMVFYGLANILGVYPQAGLAALAEMKKGLD